MKIALPASASGEIEAHFGHCSGFSIFSVDGATILSEDRLVPPPGCGCKSSIIPDLAKAGVKVMLVGNMGPGAATLITSNGIELYRGVTGNAKDAVEAYLAGTLSDQDSGCGHGDDHDCSHN